MTPTNKLRFVRRQVPINSTDTKTVNILQQWWETVPTDDWERAWKLKCDGEWRDVPMEDEA